MEMEKSRGDEKEEKKRRMRGEGDRFGMGFRFSDKDRKALRWLAEQGTASVEQLWWSAFKSETSSSPNYADERLRKMAVGGFIKRERVFGSGRTNYIITDRGMREVKESDPDRADFYPAVPRKIDVREYGHTMALNWCRLFLEKDGLGQVQYWMSDRAVRSWIARRENKGSMSDWSREIARISPDACFEFMGSRWLLEYEGTQKNKTKYQDKARALPYGRTGAVRGVIFIAATAKLKLTLESYFKVYECKCFTFDELKEGKVISYLREKHASDEKQAQERLETKAKEVLAIREEIARLKLQKNEAELKVLEAHRDIEAAKDACTEYCRRFFKTESGHQDLLKILKDREIAAIHMDRECRNLDLELTKAIKRLKTTEEFQVK